MLDWIREHKLIFIAVLLVVGFGIYALSQRPSSPQNDSQTAFTNIDMSSPMIRGNKSAKVSIIQYSDFLCPSCTYFTTQIMPTIDKKYVQSGKVMFEFRPMAFIADGSTQSGMGAYCAIDQKKFWEYHDSIYNYVADQVLVKKLDPKVAVILTSDLVKGIAGQAGLDTKSFNSCLDSQKYAEKISDVTQTANKNGVLSTPYILINGQKYQGDMTLEAVESLIKADL